MFENSPRAIRALSQRDKAKGVSYTMQNESDKWLIQQSKDKTDPAVNKVNLVDISINLALGRSSFG